MKKKFKNYLKLGVLLFGINFGYSQEIVVPFENWKSNIEKEDEIYYYKDINSTLDKFVGTWVFDNGVDFFEITFTKELHREDSYGNFADRLISSFIYKKNGVTIYNVNSLNPCLACFNGGFYADIPININKLSLIYMEPDVALEELFGDLNITFIPNIGGSDQLFWQSTWFENPSVVDIYKIPAQMLLVRQ